MKVFGLIGHPLSHAFSAKHFNAKFKQEGLDDHVYNLYDMEDVAGLHTLIADTPGLCGLNVTIPHKRSVMPLLDHIDPLAAAVGAVNTIAIKEGLTTGYNTDVVGFRETLRPLIGKDRPRALVLGSGGASRAVAFVLREMGIRFRVVSRSLERGDLLWEMVDRTIVKVCPLIINTTPLGMHPEVDGAPPLPYESIGPGHVLVDLVYNPAETKFLRSGKERGARVVNGMPMLEAQAEEAWRIWTAG